ncbi:hypothetical protein Tco_1219400 [Tanacetum coccineum]
MAGGGQGRGGTRTSVGRGSRWCVDRSPLVVSIRSLLSVYDSFSFLFTGHAVEYDFGACPWLDVAGRWAAAVCWLENEKSDATKEVGRRALGWVPAVGGREAVP